MIKGASCVVADDHPITLLGTETYLKTLDFRILGAYSNGISCLNAITLLKPDFAFLDFRMPGISGLEILKQVRMKRIEMKIVLLTMHKEYALVSTALENRVNGIVLKDSAEHDLRTAIEQIEQGKVFISEGFTLQPEIEQEYNYELNLLLTGTEKKIIELIRAFKSNKEIAEFLFISERTVEVHKRNISTKLQLPKGKNVLLEWVFKNKV